MLRKTLSAFAAAMIVVSLFTPGKVLAQQNAEQSAPQNAEKPKSSDLDSFISQLYHAAFQEEVAPGIAVAEQRTRDPSHSNSLLPPDCSKDIRKVVAPHPRSFSSIEPLPLRVDR